MTITLDAYGALTSPTELKIQRVLPGPIERAWAFLTTSDLRRQWLASGEMDLREGGAFEFVWRNDTLTTPPGKRPEGFAEEHRMKGTILSIDAPKKLVITWGEKGEVLFELKAQGTNVLLTILHARAPDRKTLLNVSAGWHTHLDILVARVSGKEPSPFWETWQRLRAEYDQQLPE